MDAQTPAAPHLTPPVQLLLRCPACGYERSWLVLTASALPDALRCERCGHANEVRGHRAGSACACCL